MSSERIQVRAAETHDLAAILAIYNDAVLNTTAVWDETPRSMQAQEEWFRAKQAQGYPVLVGVHEGQVAGFCSYGPFRAWYGYRFSVEGSIYVAADKRRCGIARQMLAALVSRAREQGYHALLAGIEARNEASIRLHEKLEYVRVGCLPEVGFKFGQWLDLVFMQRTL